MPGDGLPLGVLDSVEDEGVTVVGTRPGDADPPPPTAGTHSTSPSSADATAWDNSAALTVRVQAGGVLDRFVELDELGPVFAVEVPPVLRVGAGTSGVASEEVCDPLELVVELPLVVDVVAVPLVESVLAVPAPVDTPGVSRGPSVPPVEGALSKALGVAELVMEPLVESVEDELVESESDLFLEPESSDFSSESDPESLELELCFEPELLSFESEKSESRPESSDLLVMAGSSACWDARSTTTVPCRSSGALVKTWQNAVTVAAAIAVAAATVPNARRRCWG